MRLLVTPSFARTVKKLHPRQKADLDEAVQAIASDPGIGEAKVGDLAGIQVYKFRLTNQLYLVAYRIPRRGDHQVADGRSPREFLSRTKADGKLINGVESGSSRSTRSILTCPGDRTGRSCRREPVKIVSLFPFLLPIWSYREQFVCDGGGVKKKGGLRRP